MTARLTIKAAPGRLVRDPATGQPVPRRATHVQDLPFWRRRIADGDVLETTGGRPARKSDKQGSDS